MSITALAPEISKKRAQVLRVAAAHGARNVRVFGSVARDDSGAESDVASERGLRPRVCERVLREARPL